MPIYAYRCEACGHAKDVLQKFSDPLLTVCPSCGAEAFKKQVTAAGFQLKGSGWYVTDFRGDSKAGKPAADDSAAAEPKEAKAAADGTKNDGAKNDATKGDASKADAASGAKSDSAKADAGKGAAAAATPSTPAAPAAAPPTGSSTPAGGQ